MRVAMASIPSTLANSDSCSSSGKLCSQGEVPISLYSSSVNSLLLAVATYVFCTEYPLVALYGAMQAAVFYMVLSMALAALMKSEAAGAMVIILVLGFNSLIQGGNLRISPFWNPQLARTDDPAELLALAVQNRVGFLLATVAIAVLGFARAENREKLLGG